jgi:hypothetical protein
MNDKKKAEGNYGNPIDAVLNEHQDGELSRPESVKRVGFDVKADDLVHLPHNSSEEHSLDDTHKTLTPLETDALDEALENTMKENK